MAVGIPAQLRKFYEPQVEQLNMSQNACRVGLSADLDRDLGDGQLWVAAVGDDCLACALDLTLTETCELESAAENYCCLSAMSEASITTIPLPLSQEARPDAALAFYCESPVDSYPVHKDLRYSSYSFCFTNGFLNRTMRDNPHDGRLLAAYFERRSVCEVSVRAEAALRRLNGIDPNSPGASFLLASSLNDALAALVTDAEAAVYARTARSSVRSTQLVREAERTLRAHLNEPITLKSLASMLYVSRSRLAAVFKEETGVGIAEYLRNLRMERAGELLISSDLSIAEIGALSGYPRQSAFTEAFKAVKGMTPSAWRDMAD